LQTHSLFCLKVRLFLHTSLGGPEMFLSDICSILAFLLSSQPYALNLIL
jgi:hypothetical protein